MIDRSKIKVVKKTDAQQMRKNKKARTVSSRAVAREMVSTVTDWVTDLKVRKTEETRAAFDLLFSANRPARES